MAGDRKKKLFDLREYDEACATSSRGRSVFATKKPTRCALGTKLTALDDFQPPRWVAGADLERFHR
jgi:hypothetical protein